MNDSLTTKWRPRDFNEVVGQHEVVRSFTRALEDGASHAFLFTGPAGVGKTSLARLGAKYVGTTDRNLTEVDAATYSGIDDMRSLTQTLNYMPLGKKNTKKSLIVDECHALSRQAWQSLLKMIEEPPEWVMWFLCTTDPSKVPDTIKSRCVSYSLKLLKPTELFDFLIEIVGAEKFDTPRQVVDLCAKRAEGSPRKALSNLAACYAAKDRAEAVVLIAESEAAQEGVPFALAKAIADGWKWDRVQPLLKAMADEGTNAESVRQTVRAYFTTVIVGSTDEKLVCKALSVLDHFSEPCNMADGLSPIVTAVGRSLFSS